MNSSYLSPDSLSDATRCLQFSAMGALVVPTLSADSLDAAPEAKPFHTNYEDYTRWLKRVPPGRTPITTPWGKTTMKCNEIGVVNFSPEFPLDTEDPQNMPETMVQFEGKCPGEISNNTVPVIGAYIRVAIRKTIQNFIQQMAIWNVDKGVGCGELHILADKTLVQAAAMVDRAEENAKVWRKVLASSLRKLTPETAVFLAKLAGMEKSAQSLAKMHSRMALQINSHETIPNIFDHDKSPVFCVEYPPQSGAGGAKIKIVQRSFFTADEMQQPDTSLLSTFLEAAAKRHKRKKLPIQLPR